MEHTDWLICRLITVGKEPELYIASCSDPRVREREGEGEEEGEGELHYTKIAATGLIIHVCAYRYSIEVWHVHVYSKAKVYCNVSLARRIDC